MIDVHFSLLTWQDPFLWKNGRRAVGWICRV